MAIDDVEMYISTAYDIVANAQIWAMVELDVPPRLIGGRTMVPMRAIFEALGAEVEWDGEAQAVTAATGDTIVFMAIDKDKDEEGKFIVTGSMVNYNNIVETDVIVRKPKLAQNLKKLKPYTAIKVHGDLIGSVQETVVEEDDGWGHIQLHVA
jgi:hypothetical protein